MGQGISNVSAESSLAQAKASVPMTLSIQLLLQTYTKKLLANNQKQIAQKFSSCSFKHLGELKAGIKTGQSVLILLFMWHCTKQKCRWILYYVPVFGTPFSLSSTLPSGNILEKAGRSTLKVRCLIISDSFRGWEDFSQCVLPSSVAWELATPFLFPKYNLLKVSAIITA